MRKYSLCAETSSPSYALSDQTIATQYPSSTQMNEGYAPHSFNYLLSAVYTAFLILSYVLKIYKVPLLSFGICTIVIAMLSPIAFLFFIADRKRGKMKRLLPVLLFAVYVICRSAGDITQLLLYALSFLLILGAASGAFNQKIARKLIEVFSVLACLTVFVQSVFHYLLNIDLSFIAYDLCLSDLQYYAAKTTGSLYRPSAFFLEPSHCAQFCIFGLLSVLFPLKGKAIRHKEAAIISSGITLSTSGMGIAVTIGAWLLFFFFGNGKQSAGKRAKLIFGGLLVALTAFLLLMQFNFFANAVNRVFSTVDGYNAVWGRTLYWDSYIATLSRKDMIFGLGYAALPDVYFTGLMVWIYAYGILGIVLLVYALVKQMRWCCMFVRVSMIVYLSLLVAGNLTGFQSIALMFSLFYCATPVDRTEPTPEKWTGN